MRLRRGIQGKKYEEKMYKERKKKKENEERRIKYCEKMKKIKKTRI